MTDSVATPGVDFSSQLEYRLFNSGTNTFGAWTNVSGSTITIAAGQTRAEVRVATIADAVPNETESLVLKATITGGTNTDMANLSDTGSTIITDKPYLIASGPTWMTEGTSWARYDVALSDNRTSSTPVQISWEGDAAVGTDFEYSIDGGTTWLTSSTSNISLPAGNSTWEVLVHAFTNSDTAPEETLRLVAVTADSGVGNASTDVTVNTYIVDPLTDSQTEDVGSTTFTPSSAYTYSIVSQPPNGTIAMSGGNVVYTPKSQFSGTDSFVVQKTDIAGNQINVTATMTVTAVADAPAITLTVDDPTYDSATATNYVSNGSFETYTGGSGSDPVALAQGTSLTGWTTSIQGSPSNTVQLWDNSPSGLTGINGTYALDMTSVSNKDVTLTQTITGMTNGSTYDLFISAGLPSGANGKVTVYWNGAVIGTITSATAGQLSTAMKNFSYTVTAGTTNTLELVGGQSGGGDNDDFGVYVDNIRIRDRTSPATYSYAVDIVDALGLDKDGSESLQNITLSSTNVPSSAVLKYSDGTVITKTVNAGVTSWSIDTERAEGLKLTVNRPTVAGSFTLTATATTKEVLNNATASTTTAAVTVQMPVTLPNDAPTIGDSNVVLSNEANFIGTVTRTIDTYFSADGGNVFSWDQVASTIPPIYANGKLVTLTYSVSGDGQTGTLIGSTTDGDVFKLEIKLNAGSNADVTYTQYQSLLGAVNVASGGMVMPGGGNGDSLVLGFQDANGIAVATLIKAENMIDGVANTVNTNARFMGANNNNMNAGEKITLDFSNVPYPSATVPENYQVSTITFTFFNFDSEFAPAPDELFITATLANGGTYTKYITNADISADNTYTLVAPAGALMTKIELEAGSTSNYKIGVGSIGAVRYEANFNLEVGYQITDADGDADGGTITIGLDADQVLVGTTAPDVLLGGSGNDNLSALQGNDNLSGGAGNDTLFGGTGNDIITGGTGADVFRWSLGDAAGGSPAIDTLTDFDTTTGSDSLNLRDLLTGETSGTLANYLHFELSGGNTILHISTNGGFSADSHNVGASYTTANEHQRIVFQTTNLIGSFTTDAQVIADLISKSKLVTD
jgi:large repetitive protein